MYKNDQTTNLIECEWLKESEVNVSEVVGV
jgi:hypothetical protein